MWTTMKKKKRCIIIAQGFFEWLKKNNGKEKLPHFTKRKDGQLMCFAGLWDSVQFEGAYVCLCMHVQRLCPLYISHTLVLVRNAVTAQARLCCTLRPE